MAEVIDIRALNIMIEQQSGFVTNLVSGMDKVIVGQKHLVESLLISLLSDGHILLEGVPGLAKTLAIKTLAQLIDADFSRIQFTPASSNYWRINIPASKTFLGVGYTKPDRAGGNLSIARSTGRSLYAESGD